MTRYEMVREWRKNAKNRAVEAMGGKCVCCGYNACNRALDFHHLSAKDKSFAITQTVRAWVKIVVELRKCVLLCRNCHSEVHDGMRIVPADAARFNESFAIYRPVKEFDQCPVCGKTKNKKAKACSVQCFGSTRSKVDWDKYDLVALSKEHGFEGLGRILGVSGTAVKKHLKKRLIPNQNSGSMGVW